MIIREWKIRNEGVSKSGEHGECVSSSGQVFLSHPLTTAVLRVWWEPCAAIFVPQWWGGTNGYFHTSWCHQSGAPGEQEGGRGPNTCWEPLRSSRIGFFLERFPSAPLASAHPGCVFALCSTSKTFNNLKSNPQSWHQVFIKSPKFSGL